MRSALVLAGAMWVCNSVMGVERIQSEVVTDLVPSPVPYSLLAPEGFRDLENLPVVLSLHGGGGSRERLIAQAPLWEQLWTSGAIPPAIVVMPSVAARGFYMNYKDGSERWEDFMIGDLLAHIRKNYPASVDPKRYFIMGASMGGMGSLRIAFRYPERFAAVAALEPGIEPILQFSDMKPEHRFWRSDELLERAYGKPVDPDFWARNNPASMAVEHADSIRGSNLQIYIEAGDEDQFWLYEGAEFLHRVLWDQRIRHEYHLVRGADHVGPSLGERTEESIRFLFRSLDPWRVTPRMQAVDRMLDPLKGRLQGTDHYNGSP